MKTENKLMMWFIVVFLIMFSCWGILAIKATETIGDLQEAANRLHLEKSILQQEIRTLQGQNNFLKSQNAMLMELEKERSNE